MARLVTPGAMSPVSNDPSFATIRCTAPSRFTQATVPDATITAGLGLNDCEPDVAVMLTVTEGGGLPPPEDVGLVGVVPPSPPPHATAEMAMARAVPPDEQGLRMIGPPSRSKKGKKRTSGPRCGSSMTRAFCTGATGAGLTRAVNAFVQ
jgi:hypothetical protein